MWHGTACKALRNVSRDGVRGVAVACTAAKEATCCSLSTATVYAVKHRGLRHVINEAGDWSRVSREHLQ